MNSLGRRANPCIVWAVLALGFVGCGDTSTNTPQSVGARILNGASPTTDAQIIEGFVAGRHKVASVIKGVTDPDSARAAVPTLASVIDRMHQLKEEFDALPEDRQSALLEQYEPSLTEGAMAIGNATLGLAFKPRTMLALADEIKRLPDLQ